MSSLHRERRHAGIIGLPPTLVALAAFTAFAGTPVRAQVQDSPTIHFDASGDYSFASARITVDVSLELGARLAVSLTSPSGAEGFLSLDRDGNRFSWTGQLTEAGPWRAEATVSGAGPPETASATVSLRDGAPTCSLAISAPEQPTHYLAAEFVANSCDAVAETGDIVSRYITVLQDGVQISTLDASDQCERRFILPGGGAYEATLAVVDDRGVTATCSSAGLSVDALYPRFWPIADFATGTYNSERADVANEVSAAAWLGGGGIGITLPQSAAADRTNAISIRAGGGFAHNFWTGSSLDILVTRQTPAGFFGAGAGLWGIGDTDILDGGVFGAAGFNLPRYTGAGQLQAFTELRVFARHISRPQNNFSAIVGLRFNLKRTHRVEAR
ncbi:MAG: hypothetical protein F4Z74_00155 [Acidobacteria bacterium]|nr:hypothetical protein [Acidobacteriota bacterium]MYE43716.1 hypothetical protein [Acidobacteriota bacterium]